jgi:hypothetical protein
MYCHSNRHFILLIHCSYYQFRNVENLYNEFQDELLSVHVVTAKWITVCYTRRCIRHNVDNNDKGCQGALLNVPAGVCWIYRSTL